MKLLHHQTCGHKSIKTAINRKGMKIVLNRFLKPFRNTTRIGMREQNSEMKINAGVLNIRSVLKDSTTRKTASPSMSARTMSTIDIA